MAEITYSNGPTDSVLGKFYCRISLGKYSRPRPFGDSRFEKTSSIYLPLPDILRDTSSIKYNNTDTQTVGDLFNLDAVTGVMGFGYRNLGRMGSDFIGKAAGAAVGGAAAAVGGMLGGAANFLDAGAQNIANEMIPADQLQTAIEQSVGKASNPNPSISFAGPSLRSFNLNWTFFPTSKEESDRVFNIIKTLKQAALPSNTFSNSGAILNYPYMCQLNFFPWDSTEKDFGTGTLNRWGWTERSILRYKKCVMNSVDVDYNPSNVPGFFKEGDAPVAIRVSIGFDEIEYMLSGDWESTLGGSTAVEDTVIGAVVGAALQAAPIPTALVAGAAGYFTGDPKKDPTT
jgi:hypothetical protein